ncbi:hypothetical protein [Nonomuraea harbinensis]|uniref:Uncharacterized protein n=1 Tax=Nonomuraea harbinensis TaxID=1286938 RepID=A0ABW1C3H7_9ACTN|nr:hypothetical protein [Nonomuraea harbinensis]
MLKNHLRRDLRWLRRQARGDRRITVLVLTLVPAAWTRQLAPGDAMPEPELLFLLSAGLLAVSGAAWFTSAYFLARSARARREPVEVLRRVTRVSRAKEWAFIAAGAYVSWHVLQFVTVLVMT